MSKKVGIPKEENLLVHQLVRQLRRCNRTIGRGASTVTLTEVESAQGRPDVVHVILPRGWSRSRVWLRMLHLPSVSEVVSRLEAQRTVDPESLHKSTGLSVKGIRARIESLVRLNVVRRTEAGAFRLAPGIKVPRMKVWAFEAKIHNWKRALYQALQYRGFAHRVYVVMPAVRKALVRRHGAIFRRFGVGVIVVGEDGMFHYLIAARPQVPQSRAMYLRIVGAVMRRIEGLGY